jgi:uncharacterized protein
MFWFQGRSRIGANRLPKTVMGFALRQPHQGQRGVLAGLMGLLMLLLLLFPLPALATGVADLPVVSAGEDRWVVDEAQLLSRNNEGLISGNLRQLAKQSGSEVRFITLRRLDYGQTIQSLTDELFDEWYTTPDEQSNQVLIALDDVTNTVGIRVGDRAAERLTPDIAISVTSETMGMPLRQGSKYNQALTDAGDRLVAVLSGQADPGPPQINDTINVEGTFASAEDTEQGRFNYTTLVIVLLLLATVIPMATYWWYVR